MLSYEQSVAFVIPYFDDGKQVRRRVLRQTLDSLRDQSAGNWRGYLIDDASPAPGTQEFLEEVVREIGIDLVVLRAPMNAGAGSARNLGVRAAAVDGFELIAFLDADDLAHPERVATMQERFAADPDLDFLYSDIEFIDDHGRPWQRADLLPVLQLIDAQQAMPKLRGRGRLVEHATERDCLAIPSAMNLRTSLALSFPFPQVRFCEDVATLFRYLGSGAKIDHADGIATKYRVPRAGASSSRTLAGDLEEYNRQRCVNELAGLQDALAMAIARRDLAPEQGRELLCRYLLRIGRTVAADGHTRLGGEQLRQAHALDPAAFASHASVTDLALAELAELVGEL